VTSTRQEAKVLSSWKDIAAYLGKGVRTVQRWEREVGLPVSRPQNTHKSTVLTSTDKLDRWVATKWAQRPSRRESPPNAGSPNGIAASIRDFRRLRRANRELLFDLQQAMEGLRAESQTLVRSISPASEAKREQAKSRNVK
jgi:hypothetical protein